MSSFSPPLLKTARRAAGIAALLVAYLPLVFAAQPKQANASVSRAEGDSPPEPRFESVGARAIPRDVVAALAQDRAGFLWIATGDGLMRYDGHRFLPQERESAVPLERNLGWTPALLPARDGRLWIGNDRGELAAHDPASGRITMHPGGAGDGDGRANAGPAPSILALAEDADGAVWIGTAGGGLLRYDPVTRRAVQHRRSDRPESLPDDRVQALLVDRSGTLWVGTWQGLSRRVRGSDRFEPVFRAGGGSLQGQIVQSLFEASDGRLWVGTQQGGVAVIEPHTGTGRMLVSRAAAAPAIPGQVSSFAQDRDGRIWVGRATGIDLFDSHDGRLLRRLRHDARNPTGPAGNHVTTLLVDRAGWIWVGGFGTGLQRHNPNNRSIWLRNVDSKRGGFDGANVRSLLQLDSGEIWAATPSEGVAVLDPQLEVVARVESRPAAAGKPVSAAASAAPSTATPNGVEALAQGRDGSVWVGADSVVQQFSRDRRLLRTLRHPGGKTNRLLARADGSLWVAAQDGLYRVGPGREVIERVAQDAGEPLTGEVFALAEAPDLAMWVGGVRGLYRAGPGESKLQPISSRAGEGLGNPSVIGLLFDSRGLLWLDTGVAGLHRMIGWDGKQARFDRVSERHHALGRPFGVNLLEDRRGRIWTQMNVYDPSADRLHELTAADGVDLGTGWFRSYVKTNDGRMLFGGSKGLLVVRPEPFDASSDAPPLVVSDLRINGRSLPAGPAPKELRLAPDDRSFSLEFAALDYIDPRRTGYAFQLQGFDRDWIRTGAEMRVASYGNLSPGDYVLRARAIERSGAWSTDELRIAVRVLPAWWQRGWLPLALLPLLAISLYGIVQLRTRLLRRRQHELEAKVLERTTELERVSLALQHKSAALEASSLSDPLTGLHNRRFLAKNIDRDIALSVRRHEGHLKHGAPLADDADLAFFLVDIDHFKRVNDEHGHAGGDAVLRQMPDRLRQVFRTGDYLVRWGGEEFLIVALGAQRPHAAELAERARAAVAGEPFVLDAGVEISLTCSIGFACFPLVPAYARTLDWSSVMHLADSALYLVKRGGRNGWLGVLNARAESEASLRDWAQRPLAEWRATGALEMAGRLLGAPAAGASEVSERTSGAATESARLSTP